MEIVGVPLTVGISLSVLRDHGFISVLQLLQQNSSIRFLNIGCNDIGTRGGMYLAEFLASNASVSIVLHLFDLRYQLEILEIGVEPEHFHDNHLDSSVGASLAKVCYLTIMCDTLCIMRRHWRLIRSSSILV